ncbi:RNA polymerase III transcription factor IIIC subunit-domain-containing protein [Schizophyllum commune]
MNLDVGNSHSPPTGASAGPSTSPSTQSQTAPELPLPKTAFYSVEYPGYVQDTSVPIAVRALGGAQALDTAFKRAIGKQESLVELRLQPDNPFAHPVAGEVVQTNNLLLRVTKRKRVRRNGVPLAQPEWEYKAEIAGVVPRTVRFRGMADYQYQPDTNDPISRLRIAMDKMNVEALFSYRVPAEDGSSITPAPPSTQPPTPSRAAPPPSVPATPRAPLPPPPPHDIPLDPALVHAFPLDPQLAAQTPSHRNSALPGSSQSFNLDVDMAAPDSELPETSPTSGLRMFPPPLFSRQAIPLMYNLKANPSSIVSTTVDEMTGEEKKRLVNRFRWKGYGPATIMFSDANVPDKPPAVVEEARSTVNQDLLARVAAQFEHRKVWTRLSLYNQFSPAEAREIHNSKLLLPLTCYVFQDGPFRDTLVKFSYDPRKDINGRFFQRFYFRNANHPIVRPSVTARRADRSTSIARLDAEADAFERQNSLTINGQGPHAQGSQAFNARRSHIFDGKTLAKETAAFQLCDIEDPMLKGMIEDAEELREVCDDRDGWYTTHALERIKMVLRHKFFSLLEGHVASDEECWALLEKSEGHASYETRYVKRHGKHNMAKGAMRPEDAAAMRLRAILDKNAKEFQEQFRQGQSLG